MPQRQGYSYKDMYDGLCERYDGEFVHRFFNEHEANVLSRHGLLEATPVTARENGYPALGSALPRSEWGKTGVIGTVEKSANGNAVLHVGNLREDDPGWEKVAHVAMSPEEREQLITELIAMRGKHTQVSCECCTGNQCECKGESIVRS